VTVGVWSLELDGRVSGMVWTVMFVSLAATVTIHRPAAFLTFVISVIVRCIFSVGIQPTLTMLGVLNVSHSLNSVLLLLLT